MTARLATTLLLLIVALAAAGLMGDSGLSKPAAGQLPPAWPQPSDISAGEVVVELASRGKPSLGALPAPFEAQAIGKSRRFAIRIDSTGSDKILETLQAANALRCNPDALAIDLNYTVKAFGEPDDMLYDRQWHLPRIAAPAAWDTERGDKAVAIAVLDTGVDMRHPDLADKLLPGYDFVNDDRDARDDHGHGTHVAGAAAAATDNGTGVAGVCWACPILPVKALSSTGFGSHTQIANSLYWAADNGAHIINMSFGSPYTSATLHDAIAYAHEQNVVLVAAAGNLSSRQQIYPAAFRDVIAVAATDANNRRPTWSNWGAWISLAAPGTRIWSTIRNSRYQAWSGTSMASPLVAGAAGLIASRHPAWSSDQIREAIEQNTAPLDDAGLGAGLLDVAAALAVSAPTASLATMTPSPSATVPTTTPRATASSTPAPGAESDELHRLINDYRQANNRHKLLRDERLDTAAARHAIDMQQNGFCGHAGSDGSSPYQRMLSAGYPAPLFEIVACGYQSADIIMAAIKRCASPGCGDPLPRERILSEASVAVGIAARDGHWAITLGGSESRPPTPTPPAPEPTATPASTIALTAAPTLTAEPAGFWLWCWRAGEDAPLQCEQRER